VTAHASVSTGDPPRRELRKETAGVTATGAPKVGRTRVDRALSRGPLGALRLLGPGLITGASDDDPSGIATYSQVGSQFGYGLLWTALFTLPLMTAVQELCARIALQTGVGLGVTLRRKFPAALVGGAVLALLVANTINIGADLGAVAAGINLLVDERLRPLYLVIPVAAMILMFQLFSTYGRLVSIFKWLTLALFAYVITAVLSHPSVTQLATGTVVPHLEVSADFIAALVAVLGTTISPYLFFWQASSEVDELHRTGEGLYRQHRGVNKRQLVAARVDVMIGMAFSQVVMYCVILTSASALHAHGHTNVQTAQQVATSLAPLAGRFAFVIFAVGLIGTGLLAIPVLSGSAAYAAKEFLGIGGGLATKPRQRPTFYLIIIAATLVGVVLNAIGLDPIRALFITAVINGIVAAPLLVLIVLLGSDRRVMGRRVSRGLSRVLTWLAAGFMAIAAVALLVTLVRH